MYEHHFGITGLPFQLSPDPYFYFDSPQHHAAMAMVRHAFDHAPPILVLSGEVGAGKTTILSAWALELEAAGVAVGQLVTTQLDAADLTRAVATAFGLAEPAALRIGDDPGWQWLLDSLHGRRALLIIDEAQNLADDALLRVVQLAGIVLRRATPMRICLAGQPELRTRIDDPLFQRIESSVQQAFHLVALQRDQMRGYIEHRLTKVGWAGTPSFDADTFGEIHRLTAGVPRRINMLCNRLLMAQFLGQGVRIDVRTVLETARALDLEIGEEISEETGEETSEEIAAAPPPVVPPAPAHPAPVEHGAILIVTSGRSDHIKAVPLLTAIGLRGDLPNAAVVSVSDRRAWHIDRDIHLLAGIAQEPVCLNRHLQPPIDTVPTRFAQLIAQCRPALVVMFDGDPLLEACAAITRESRVPLVHVGADMPETEGFTEPRSSRAVIGQLASLHFDCRPTAGQLRRFVQPSRYQSVGSLLFDALRLALQLAMQRPRDAHRGLPPRREFDSERGYGVVALMQPPGEQAPCRQEFIAVLRNVSRDLHLVWPMRSDAMQGMHGGDLERTLEADRVSCIEELTHPAFILLLRHATCTLTDSVDVREEAAALGVPCIWLDAGDATGANHAFWLPGIAVGSSVTLATRAVWSAMFNGDGRAVPPDLGDGHCAARIAQHLAHWLADPR